MVMVMASIAVDVPKRVLPYESWQPFDISSPIGYWIAYTHQIIALIYGGVIHIASDTLVSGMMLSGCTQFKILNYRLKSMPDAITDASDLELNRKQQEVKQLASCVNHHLVIFKLRTD